MTQHTTAPFRLAEARISDLPRAIRDGTTPRVAVVQAHIGCFAE